jgi:DNA polymerase-3 subunit beta
MPAEDFPLPSFSTAEATTFTIACTDLAWLIAQTQFAICKEKARYYLRGIFLCLHDSRLRAVATNGHVIATAALDADRVSVPETMPSVIVPEKTIERILDLLKTDPNGKAAVEISRQKIRATVGAAVLTSKLIDGEFPDWQRVIPRNNPSVIEFDAGALAQAVERIAIVVNPGYAIKFLIEDNTLTVSGRSAYGDDSAVEPVDVTHVGPTLQIGFSPEPALDILRHIEGRAVWEFGGPGEATLIKPKDGGRALFVLMPMRTR